MDYYQYLFKCSKSLSEHEVHYLYYQLVKQHGVIENFKFEKQGSILSLFTDSDLDCQGTKIELFEASVVFLRKTQLAKTNFQVGQRILLTGTINYVTHISAPKTYVKTIRPCSIANNLNDQVASVSNFKTLGEQREHFKSYLETTLGIDLTSVENNPSIGAEALYIPRQSEDQKVHFKGVTQLSLIGAVKDAQIVNAMSYKTFGQKKTYGFGSFEVYELGSDESQAV